MARKLINFCLAWTLVLGCWGGALAAAACTHVDCEAAAATHEAAASCAAHSADEAHERAATHDASAVAQGHDDHAEAHEGHAHGAHAAEQSPTGSAESSRSAFGSQDASCSHCVGRPEAPPSPRVERQLDPAGRAAKEAAARAALHVLSPTRAHPREITPAQHAPPAKSGRHILLNVFRI